MALTSAFGYGAIGSASALAPEVFAAAAEAAGNAAVAEATTAANGQDGKSLSPTTQYLEDLSPSGGTEEEREEAGRWRGAEIAAMAAADAAGAAAGAAGSAAGVAAEYAAAAAAATLAVAAGSLPFGTDREDDMATRSSSGGGWQVAGRWRKGWDLASDDDDDADFGEGRLGIKPKRLERQKAEDMVLDPMSSAGLKVRVCVYMCMCVVLTAYAVS